jgi:hypothetical protein
MGTERKVAFDKKETDNACRGENVVFETASKANFLRTSVFLFSIKPFLVTESRECATLWTDIIWLSTVQTSVGSVMKHRDL